MNNSFTVSKDQMSAVLTLDGRAIRLKAVLPRRGGACSACDMQKLSRGTYLRCAALHEAGAGSSQCIEGHRRNAALPRQIIWKETT